MRRESLTSLTILLTLGCIWRFQMLCVLVGSVLKKTCLIQHLNHNYPVQMIVFILYLLDVEYYFIIMT